jgi:small subunit ribosomal protein S4e
MRPIPDAEANTKLLRIMGKSWPTGGGLQLNLHDGSNIMLPATDTAKYSVGDVLQVSLPDRKIKDHMKIEPGNVAFLHGGKSVGQVGIIEKVTKGQPMQPTMVTLSVGGKEFQTLEDFIFVVGVKKPKIKVD